MNDVKKKILTKSSELFVKQGVRKTSMDEISSSLSISKRTVYECFRSKEELLKICVLNRIEEYKNEVEIKTRGGTGHGCNKVFKFVAIYSAD